MKKLLSFLLAICMLTGFMALLPSFAADEPAVDFEDGSWTAVSTVAEFQAMTADGKYYLTNDIDFGGASYEGSILRTDRFSGIFDGCGYSLLNFTMTPDGNGTGVFNQFFHGTLKNLTIGAENAPVSIETDAGNKSIGIVSKSIELGEEVVFENVTVYTNMTCTANSNTDTRFAAFAGYCDKSPTEFINCHVYGSISGQPAAGFVVTNGNESVNLTFRSCSNNAAISSPTNRSQPTAGFFAESWSGSGAHATLNFYDCENNGAITSGDYPSGDRNSAGGFVCFRTNFIADVYMEGCANSGKITAADGCGAGFIVVRKDGVIENSLATYTVKNCVNNGDVAYLDQPKNTSSAGILAIPTNVAATVVIENSANLGNITGGANGAGGIMNVWTTDTAKIDITITGCFNAGTVKGGENSRPAGIAGNIGYIADESAITVSYCYNAGSVSAGGDNDRVAGIVAELDPTASSSPGSYRVIKNCYNIGELISDKEKVALGRADWDRKKDYVRVENSFYTNDLNATNGGCGESGNAKVADASEMLTKLTEAAVAESSVQFVEDIYGINGGYPVLSWQVVTSDAANFGEGTIVETAENKYAVTTDSVSGFISTRKGDTASDIRFILAVDLEAAKAYETVGVTVTFCDAVGVVKSFTLDYEDLTFYLEAYGAGNTYVAGDGDALFGVVVTGVPNDAWDYVILTVNTAEDSAMAGFATSAILG